MAKFTPKVTPNLSHLSPISVEVTQHQGTEKPFSGQYWNHFAKGSYQCICCGAPLFLSDNKFDAGCGWPSFDRPSHIENIATAADKRYNMYRIEVMCQQCGAHLGHVFDDGPTETGARYCINSAAIRFMHKQGDDDKHGDGDCA